MKPGTINLLLIAVVLIFTACSSGDKKEGSDMGEKNEKFEKAPPPPPVSYAPGTVSVEVIIKSLKLDNSPKNCIVTIKKINGYGSAAPAVAEGGDIEVVLPDNVLKAKAAENLKTGTECSMIIRTVEKMGSEKLSNWICIKIN